MFRHIRNAIISASMIIAIYFVALIPTTIVTTTPAQAAECSLYETIHPNFPLTGAHLSTGKCSTCASCHAGGVFLGTPKICATCHSGNWNGSTMGKSASHIPVSVTTNCDSCHNTTSFTATWQMTHSVVSGQRCDSCHNGSYSSYGAMAKTPTHIMTSSDCGSCHTPKDNPTHTVSDWSIPLNVIHAGITTGCVACHDGAHATGKANYAPGHPTTSDACETCHSITNSFKCD